MRHDFSYATAELRVVRRRKRRSRRSHGSEGNARTGIEVDAGNIYGKRLIYCLTNVTIVRQLTEDPCEDPERGWYMRYWCYYAG